VGGEGSSRIEGFQFSTGSYNVNNKSAISIIHNPVLHDGLIHMEVNKHFFREKIEKGQICISYVPQKNNP